MNPMKPLLECKKCGIVSDDYTITESGMHLRADCSKCGQYIKYLSKEDKYCTKEQEEEVFEKTKGRCGYCGIWLNPKSKIGYTVDHIIPQKLGGLHDIENLILACKPCNCQKNAKTLEDYRTYLMKKNNTHHHIFWAERVASEMQHISEILKNLYPMINPFINK